MGIGLLIGLALFAFWIWSLWECATVKSLLAGQRIVWFCLILCVPIVGAVLWFCLGPRE